MNMKRGISFDGLDIIRQMKRIFKREKFDLVQYSTPNASLYASIAAKSARIPVRLYCQWGIVYTGFSGWKRKLFKLEEKLVCRKSTWIEPDSNSNLRFARAEGLYTADKSSVLWNGSACGVDLKKFDISLKDGFRREIRSRYGITDEEFVFIFVGRVKRDKGINELLEASKHMIADRPFRFFILGPDESDEAINNELYDWSISEERMIYTGEVNDVEKYLAAADCYVLPSYREGFGMSVIEAQAMGVPVIVTDIPGPIDGMKKDETGFVIPVRDASALKIAMEKMYGDPGLRDRFGAAGYRYIKDNFEQQRFFSCLLDDRMRLLDKKMTNSNEGINS